MSPITNSSFGSVWSTMSVLCGRWRAPILHCLSGHPLRFSELETCLDCATAKVLMQHLRMLEQNGLVSRGQLRTHRRAGQYGLTPYGRTILPLLDEIKRWGEQHRHFLSQKTEEASLAAVNSARE